MQREDGHLQAQDGGFRRRQACLNLVLGILASGTVREEMSAVEAPSSAGFC